MENPSDLIDSIVAAFKAIPEVVAALEATAGNVKPYKRSYPTAVNIEAAINELNPPAILVAHKVTSFGRRGIGAVEHRFRIIMRPKGSADDLFKKLREGTPTGYDGQKLKFTVIHAGTHPPFFEDFVPSGIFVSEQAFLELHEATLVLTEQGPDS